MVFKAILLSGSGDQTQRQPQQEMKQALSQREPFQTGQAGVIGQHSSVIYRQRSDCRHHLGPVYQCQSLACFQLNGFQTALA